MFKNSTSCFIFLYSIDELDYLLIYGRMLQTEMRYKFVIKRDSIRLNGISYYDNYNFM